MRRSAYAAMTAVMVAGLLAAGVPASSEEAITTRTGGRYVVLARPGVSQAAAQSAIRATGAKVIRTNGHVGLSTVRATSDSFGSRLMESGLFTGIGRDRAIGRSPRNWLLDSLRTRRAVEARPLAAAEPKGGDPLARFQWNMNMVDADFGGSYSHELGDPRTLVGIMDSGVDYSHRDLRANFNQGLSRNFTRDMPSVDGPCREEKDRSCEDSPLEDATGHGSWVASAVASPLNGFGISGVAPNVSLVSLRVAQDSGYIFVQSTVDALTYAADNGIDVVNMSFFVDPWLFNCPNNDADSPEEQLEQQTIIAAVQEAVDYARSRGVTLVAALGNSWTDLDNPTTDLYSPYFPPGTGRERAVDDSCLLMPGEADGVVGVSALGPSRRKAFYSNYGLDATDVAAPGGDDFDAALPFHYNMPVGVAPKAILKEFGLLRKDGKPKFPVFIRRCTASGRCFYYFFGWGTSFSSPVAAGVAALIVSRFGTEDGDGGITMAPDEVERILYATAEPHACPEGGVQEYPEIGDTLVQFGLPSWEAFTATCEEGPGGRNGFYGHGIVNAYNAVTYQP